MAEVISSPYSSSPYANFAANTAVPCEDTCLGRILGLSAPPCPGSGEWMVDLPTRKQIYFLEAQEIAALIVSRGGATRGASGRERDEPLSAYRLAGRCSTIPPPGTNFGSENYTKTEHGVENRPLLCLCSREENAKARHVERRQRGSDSCRTRKISAAPFHA
jgi:hypothetical protein